MLLDLARLGSADISAGARAGGYHALISAAYLVIGGFCVVYGYAHGAPFLRTAGVVVLSLGGLLTWLGSLKRFRAIADTPTAKLRSAPQGYVELTGTCKPVPESDLLYYGKAPPCVWYHATILEREGGFGRNRTRTRHVRSEDTFSIEDGTGECVVDPEHAEVLSAHHTRWRVGSTHYKVEYLLPKDRIYAIGDLHTLRAADGILDRRSEVGALLREWKQNRADLLRRFDSNEDGDIDLREWQHAVHAAEGEIDALHREMRLDPGIHLMRAPQDGRPFLLSNRDPNDLARRYRLVSWLHLTVFVAASVWGMASLLDLGG